MNKLKIFLTTAITFSSLNAADANFPEIDFNGMGAALKAKLFAQTQAARQAVLDGRVPALIAAEGTNSAQKARIRDFNNLLISRYGASAPAPATALPAAVVPVSPDTLTAVAHTPVTALPAAPVLPVAAPAAQETDYLKDPRQYYMNPEISVPDPKDLTNGQIISILYSLDSYIYSGRFSDDVSGHYGYNLVKELSSTVSHKWKVLRSELQNRDIDCAAVMFAYAHNTDFYNAVKSGRDISNEAITNADFYRAFIQAAESGKRMLNWDMQKFSFPAVGE